MRIRAAPDDALERVAIALKLVPLPAGHVLYGLTAGRVVGTAQRLGIFAELLQGPATAGRLAEQLSLQVAGTRILCENLAGLGILDQDGHSFSLPKSSRKWLDPASDTYLGTWIEHSVTYWEWYGDLERIVRDEVVPPPVEPERGRGRGVGGEHGGGDAALTACFLDRDGLVGQARVGRHDTMQRRG